MPDESLLTDPFRTDPPVIGTSESAGSESAGADLLDGDPLEGDPGDLDGDEAHAPAPRRAIGTWEWDPATDSIDVSITARLLLGLPAGGTHGGFDELLGGIWTAHRRRVTGTLRAAMDVDAPFTSRFATVADPTRTVRVVGQPVTVAGARRLAGIVEDVTESARDEQALQRSQRLASLGMLAAGIAHDVNNVLTVVSMRADMIRTDAVDKVPGDPVSDASAILEAADRAAALTRQLMLFAGQQEGETRPVDLAGLADGMRPMVSSLRGSQVEVEFDLHPVPPVLADPVQLEQVLLNLALNARDALTDLPPGDDTVARVIVRVLPSAGPVGQVVLLEVSDNGPGMDAETLARACDPFFTTKPTGRGTGLGLSVVFGIAERLGGRLDITSQVGAGTTVRVLLPALRTTEYRSDAGVADDADSPAERVLVVGVEPSVRAVHGRVLERAGYEVVLAGDGFAALKALAADPGIVAVLSDMLMPGMDGTELAGRVLRDHPAVRVLLVTGVAPPTDVLVHPRVGLVGKPITASQLVGELHALLAVGSA